ncbi:MAG: N-acetylmuramoyl-L-alanine amidase [Desulfobacterales bacterium]|nr:N-acetylmuramoyl-L-alanine amidase [Desulfobacterales bacterium]
MYTVKFYTGDYYARQQKANGDDCLCYVEHHLNSSTNPDAGYSVVITGSNASQTSKNWGRWYAQAVAKEFDLRLGGDQGIQVGGYSGRGDYNLRYTKMPAILLEPLFASNPQHAQWIRSESGQDILASILKESIERFFQEKGTIAFSVGHKYKESRPKDLGASVHGGGAEADYAEIILKKAKTLLDETDGLEKERLIKIIKEGETLWSGSVDSDDDVNWDPIRGVLSIK